MESLRMADLSLLGQRTLSTQELAQPAEKAVDTVTLRRLPTVQPMLTANPSNVLRYGNHPDWKDPSAYSIHGLEDVQKKVALGTQAESLNSHEASKLPAQGREDTDSQMMAADVKKRRRGAKAYSGKKFECTHEGCGKIYSRAEHLDRHQLNRQ